MLSAVIQVAAIIHAVCPSSEVLYLIIRSNKEGVLLSNSTSLITFLIVARSPVSAAKSNVTESSVTKRARRNHNVRAVFSGLFLY